MMKILDGRTPKRFFENAKKNTMGCSPLDFAKNEKIADILSCLGAGNPMSADIPFYASHFLFVL